MKSFYAPAYVKSIEVTTDILSPCTLTIEVFYYRSIHTRQCDGIDILRGHSGAQDTSLRSDALGLASSASMILRISSVRDAMEHYDYNRASHMQIKFTLRKTVTPDALCAMERSSSLTICRFTLS
jgi:hypothetical protein